MQAGAKFGMQTMDQMLVQLVRKHLISYDTALTSCHSVEELNRMLGREGKPSAAKVEGGMEAGSIMNVGGLNNG
jgi:Tfp pilus assembly ATPase PilU